MRMSRTIADRCLCLVTLLSLLAGGAWAGEQEESPPSPDQPAAPQLRFLRVNEHGTEEWLRIKDKAVMLRIPGGTYAQRPYERAETSEDPKPVHVKSFFIDKYEVTNEQFAPLLARMWDVPPPPPESRPPYVWLNDEWLAGESPGMHDPGPHFYTLRPGRERYPVTVATGRGAVEYAKWVGGRLPTLAEWEKAAGGPKGRVYPWGTAKPDRTRANFGHGMKGETLPVGSFHAGASQYGALDMAGNVYERVYAPGRKDPVVIKGGSWASPHPLNLRVLDMCVQPMGVADRTVGFRVVMDDPEPDRPLRTRAKGPQLLLRTDFSEAIEEAQARNVPVFLSLHLDTCGQCDRTRAQLFRDKRFVEFANEHLVVLVGQDPGDASLGIVRSGEDLPSPYKGIARTALQQIYRQGLRVVGAFQISPGNFLLDPHAAKPGAGSAAMLVEERSLSKWGNDVHGYLSAFERARSLMRKRHGAPKARAAVETPGEDEG